MVVILALSLLLAVAAGCALIGQLVIQMDRWNVNKFKRQYQRTRNITNP